MAVITKDLKVIKMTRAHKKELAQMLRKRAEEISRIPKPKKDSAIELLRERAKDLAAEKNKD
ncbi:hypothetical protein P8818_00450 [Bacillus velezensis]|uniref:hypothetical protein n=1 Tax=Bacillus velezensis TaxID=492670 RepID=UPI002DBB4D65|nr:hypothetical protein [Bacillus velezensis]MEC0386064.1 hypothetical protein [Bacillus velezensis]